MDVGQHTSCCYGHPFKQLRDDQTVKQINQSTNTYLNERLPHTSHKVNPSTFVLVVL